MNTPLVTGSWTHTCLRVPGRDGQPTPLILQGVGGCIFCGDPGPEQQPKVDEAAARILRWQAKDDEA